LPLNSEDRAYNQIQLELLMQGPSTILLRPYDQHIITSDLPKFVSPLQILNDFKHLFSDYSSDEDAEFDLELTDSSDDDEDELFTPEEAFPEDVYPSPVTPSTV
jgi:hypothetical protein